MSQLKLRRLLVLPLVCAVFVMGACEGESRPFQESVEVTTLGLTGLQVVPPVNAQSELVINRGQAIQVGINGLNEAGADVELSASDRAWESSDTNVVGISEDGVVTGGIDGTAQVSVSIGGIQSTSLAVTVSDQPLVALNSIEGSEMVELCLPETYFVVGRFADQTLRTLTQGIAYSVLEDSLATVTDAANAAASLIAMSSGELLLTATSGSVTPVTLRLNVLSNLDSIAISSAATSVDVGETIEFTATGTYNSNSGVIDGGNTGTPVQAGTRPEDITANVDWQVTSGSANASVGNSTTDGGQLNGLEAGTAILQASCGNVASESQSVLVNASDASDSDELSFNVPDNGFLDVGINENPAFQLQVQRGSDFDEEDNDANLRFSDLVFTVTVEPDNGGDATGIIDTTAINTGTVRGLSASNVRVRVQLLDDDNDEVANGSFIVRVTSN